ncbi:ABC transporter permease [Flavitalea sp. BT771]|uniref:ABC transporter permease n=1 Tax=Flavitalea sp. BT771 TaxID=3063329 RepID=UPI0026E1FEC4|nr:ABC transporter permease [Flavitalea sp. BT771]MDO6435003.1 ABC transporter permease [Flavitalea sp. BT771]MDV6223903.1 ABC transporter permease [Flavitalea sp. BT771]
MFQNYFKTALRNLWRSKGFSAINILGLAVGLATCLLIVLYVTDELSFDKWNVKADRTYRLDAEIKFGGNHMFLAVAPPLAGPSMLQDYPEVQQYTRFRYASSLLVRKGSMNIREEGVIYTDSSFFDVFTMPLLSGDARTALNTPHSIVITEKIARKYFNRVDVAGRILVINDSIQYKVTAVIRNMPSQSHFRYDIFLPMLQLKSSRATDEWLSHNYNTYIVLKEGADAVRLETKLPGMVEKYMAPLLKHVVNLDMKDFSKSGGILRFSLTPLTSIHLHSNRMSELNANGNIQYVYIFSGIAAFILLIACINFMNLSTARSSSRAKEVGVRKVMGSLRRQLIIQFIVESTVISFMALLLAVGIAALMLPWFNQLAGKEIGLGFLARPWLVPSLLILGVVVGLLAGSYPAFFLSAFRPIAVLKGNLSAGFKTGWLRNALVIFQFGVSIFLIVGTAVIYQQLGFIRSKNLGYDRNHVLVLGTLGPLGSQARAFREDLLKMPGVAGATMTGFLPTASDRNSDAFFRTPALDQRDAILMQTWPVDEHYVSVLGMHVEQGRDFSRSFLTDSNGILINSTTARMLGTGNPLGARLYQVDDIKTRKIREWHVVGVVKDFNFNSLREVVTPMALYMREDRGSLALRVRGENIPRLISQIENKWKSMAPGQPFSYSFMDDDFNAQYKAEGRMGGISLSFSLLAICIACLGLFGLAAYAAEQRTREIGIRKVMGATVANIVSLLSRDFLVLVLVAALIAFPFAWWAMHRWLEDFAYRISIGWQVFGLAAVLAGGIALFTISFQAFKAALANPVRSLRSE